MELTLSPQKLVSLPSQLIEMGDGIVIKRGRLEIKVAGSDAAQIVYSILERALGGATKEEILQSFSPPEHPQVDALIDHLIGRRILVSEDSDAAVNVDAESSIDLFYWHFGTSKQEMRQELNSKRIGVLGVNLIANRLVAGLRASGAEQIQWIDQPLLRNPQSFDENADTNLADPSFTTQTELDPEMFDCLVATSDGGAAEQLRRWNEFCVLHGLQFLPVMLQDLVGYVGPIVIPGHTACYECLRSRQNAHLADPATRRAVESALIAECALNGFHPAMASILGDIASIELTKHFGLGKAFGQVGTVIEVNLLGCEMSPRRVLKLPRCQVCSNLNRKPSPKLTRAMVIGADEEAQP